MSNMNPVVTIMIGSSQAKKLAQFYEKVIGRAPDTDEGGWYGWGIGSCYLTLGEHSEVSGKNREPARMMLNFEANNVKEEFERINKLGAETIKAPYEMGGGWIATLADPDGNYFQLMTPWESEII